MEKNNNEKEISENIDNIFDKDFFIHAEDLKENQEEIGFSISQEPDSQFPGGRIELSNAEFMNYLVEPQKNIIEQTDKEKNPVASIDCTADFAGLETEINEKQQFIKHVNYNGNILNRLCYLLDFHNLVNLPIIQI